MNKGQLIPSPTGGIDSYSNDFEISPIHAYSMVNWIPGLRECYIRGGSSLFQSPGSETIDTLMQYNQTGTDKLFSVMDGDIYDIESQNLIQTFDINITDGLLQWIQLNTEGGQFLMFFNGEDSPGIYNGSSLSNVAIGKDPNVTTAFPNLTDFIWCHVHQNRLWIGAKNSLDCWYMPVSTISGNSAKLWRFKCN